MKRMKLAVVVFAAAAAICALAYLMIDNYYDSAGGPTLSLWYIRSDCAEDRLRSVLKDYGRHASRENMRVSPRGFDSEEELAEALETEVPDLLLCSAHKALDLGERGLLSEAAIETPAYPEDVLELMPSSGRCFFPVGARVGLLLMNKTLCTGMSEPASFEELVRQCTDYAGRSGAPFLSAQSYAELVNALMCSLDAPFTGDIHADAADDSFKRIYNLLAGCGYEHALTAPSDGCAQDVCAGELPCAFVYSTALSCCDGKDVSVLPLPLPEGGAAVCPAELIGVALTTTRSANLPSAAAFLGWLNAEGRCDALALASALMPLGTGKTDRGLFWAEALTELAQRRLVYVGGDSAYLSRRAEFDAVFSEALDLLG